MVPPRAMNWICRDLSLADRQLRPKPGLKRPDLPSSNVTIFFRSRNIAINVSGFIDLGTSTSLRLADAVNMVVRAVRAIGHTEFVLSVLFHLECITQRVPRRQRRVGDLSV